MEGFPCGKLVDAAGNVCLLYTLDRQPYSRLVSTTACACYTQCQGEDPCAFRKFCPAGRKRLNCESDPLVPHSEANPCTRWVHSVRCEHAAGLPERRRAANLHAWLLCKLNMPMKH